MIPMIMFLIVPFHWIKFYRLICLFSWHDQGPKKNEPGISVIGYATVEVKVFNRQCYKFDGIYALVPDGKILIAMKL